MPEITVTGATGHLGALIIDHLLKRGVKPENIRASVRDVAKAAHLANQGIEVRRGNYDDPASLEDAFADTRHLLMVSADQVGIRVEQHRHAVEAATKMEVGHIVYTSLVTLQKSADNMGPNPLEMEHRPTEKMIISSKIPYTILRNSFYAEGLIDQPIASVDAGVYVSSHGDGKFGAVSRGDLAEAAAVVLSQPGHENKLYDLTYPRAWSMTELAGLIRSISGKPFEYRAVSDDEMRSILVEAGLPEGAVDFVVGMNRDIRLGALSLATPDLTNLLGHPPTSLESLVTNRLRNQ